LLHLKHYSEQEGQTIIMLRLFVQIAGLFVVFGAAPTTFPYENEAFVPADMLASTPSYTYDETDPGGYMYSTTLFHVVTEADLPFCAMRTGSAAYLLVNTFGAPPHYGTSQIVSFNCTAKDLVFASADYTGTVAGNTICKAGECCSGLYGKVKFGADQLTWHSWLDDRSAAGICGPIEENVYCTLAGGDALMNCIEYVTSPDTRLEIGTCGQTIVMYMMECKVFLTTYTRIYVTEPPIYIDASTLEENMANDAFSKSQDKLCHPHSYYFPAGSSSTSASESSSNTFSGVLVAVSCFLFLL